MKTKIVLWGNNEKEEKVLIAIELVETENKVRIIAFPEEVATEEFYNQMMNLWREGQPVPFPDGHDVQERPLSMTESLLPDDLKTLRADILTRAKTEWHFVVLSAKLYSSYMDEILEFKQRISELNSFDTGIWEEMKAFWSKVQHQVREKNLFKEHANDLRSKTNSLFDGLKSLKRVLDEEFERQSKDHLSSFMEKLQGIEDRIEKGLGLQPIFNELKGLQRKFRDTSFTRKDRSDVWKRLDGAFKLVKEKKFGKKQGDGSALTRINRRYEGLLSAISKMETSINRDKKEKSFQVKRIETTGGQLELQIRQAKLAMIDERISSKEQKLEEMLKTKDELERKISLEKKKEEKRKAKEQASAPKPPEPSSESESPAVPVETPVDASAEETPTDASAEETPADASPEETPTDASAEETPADASPEEKSTGEDKTEVEQPEAATGESKNEATESSEEKSTGEDKTEAATGETENEATESSEEESKKEATESSTVKSEKEATESSEGVSTEEKEEEQPAESTDGSSDEAEKAKDISEEE